MEGFSLPLFFTKMVWYDSWQRVPILRGGEEGSSGRPAVFSGHAGSMAMTWFRVLCSSAALKVRVHQASQHFCLPSISPEEPLQCATQTMGTGPHWMATWNLCLPSALANPWCYNAPYDGLLSASHFPITLLVFYYLSSEHPISLFRFEISDLVKGKLFLHHEVMSSKSVSIHSNTKGLSFPSELQGLFLHCFILFYGFYRKTLRSDTQALPKLCHGKVCELKKDFLSFF